MLAQRVLETADRLGYVPNNVSRALRLQRSTSWAVIVQGLNAFIASVVEAVEAAAARDGTSVYLGITDFDDERERRYVQTSISQQVGGLIVGHASNLDTYEGLAIPIVFVDRGVPDSPHDSVTIDNRLAGRLAAEHLWEQGFTRVAYIAGDQPDTPSPAARTAWSRRWPPTASTSPAVPPDHRLLAGRRPGRDGRPAGTAGTARGGLLHQRAGHPGAFLGLKAAWNDSIALVGTDDEPWTALATPTITVVQQPVAEIGETAARLLSERVAGYDGPPRQVVLQPTLIVRESSRRA